MRKSPSGKVWTGYYYCAAGQKNEVPLGTNWDDALAKWDQLHNQAPAKRGTMAEAFDKFEDEVLPTKGAVNARDYRQHLKALRPVFDMATWDTIKRPILQKYMDKRTAKPQGVKEIKLLGYVWEFAKTWGMTNLDNPVRGWRFGKVLVRKVTVTDEAFELLYKHAEPTLRDIMDLVTSIGIRLTDVWKLQLTDIQGDALRVEANKTGKVSDFIIPGSLLEGMIARRKQNKQALHIMFLTMPNGSMVTYGKARGMWDRAREKAAREMPEVAKLFLRDMRKRASNLAASDEDAAKLLQHSGTALTKAHYRTRGERVRPVR